MAQPHRASLYTRTLFTGIILGVVAMLAMVFSNQFMQSFGLGALDGTNPAAMTVAQLYMFTAMAAIPFSAALISAALVMRHLDNRLAAMVHPEGRRAQAEGNGG